MNRGGGIVRHRKGKTSSSASMKFRQPNNRTTSALESSCNKGRRPLADRASVLAVLSMMWIHLCRKVIHPIRIEIRIVVYLVSVLAISLVGDFSTFPRTFMITSDNFLNRAFVKFGWFWTFLTTGIFISLTSKVSGCGKSSSSLLCGGMRLFFGTGVWYIITALLFLIEDVTGVCNATAIRSKVQCLLNGFLWKGFDISGHSFLLVWNNLFIIEEGIAYLGWEGIKKMIRNEEYRRVSTQESSSQGSNPLSKLNIQHFLELRKNYSSYTIWIRGFYCILSWLVLLWDCMLLSTAMYYHTTTEKVAGCSIAVACWLFLYRFLYRKLDILPGTTGEFQYLDSPCNSSSNKTCSSRNAQKKKLNRSASWSEIDKVPTFMGMPIYNYRGRKTVAEASSLIEPLTTDTGLRKSSVDLSVQRPLKSFARSRSASRSRLNLAKKHAPIKSS